MKGNPMRAGVSRGETQFGTWVNMVHSPSILTLLKAAGLDFARVDMEHSAFSMETMSQMAALSRALDRIASGVLPVIDTIYPLDDFRAGVKRLEHRDVFGKILVQL